jgi:hypothetical protein
MFKLHNWVQELVQSFTLYGGGPAGGGGTFGGGKPFNPMQQNQPFTPTFGGRPPSMPQYQTINFGGNRVPQGMPQPQGLPMQGGQFGNMNPANVLPAQPQRDLAPYINPVRPIPQVQQSQVMPMQNNSFAGEGRPFNPQALQNIPYLMNFNGNRPPAGMGLPAQQPRDFMSLIGGGKPFRPTF